MEKAKSKTNLLIVESPAKAKTIKKYLGRGYNVMASMGHLRDLPKSQLGIDTEKDFEPKYITIRGKGDLTSAMKKAAKNAKKVFIATDPDREGEAIAWHIAAILGIDEKSDCRVTFNEITKTAVSEAIKKPRSIDLSLVDAQQARRIVDRLLGYKLSPLLWTKIGSGLSAGRVQSVTTKMVVDREREIEAFVPEEYWSIKAMLKNSDGTGFEANFHGVDGKKKALKSEADAEKIKEMIKGESYKVTDVKYSEKQLAPKPPFTTSSMQQEAAKQLGFTAKRTMAAAQILYEGVDIEGKGTLGLITYMRTDSLRISDEAKANAREYIKEKYGEAYLPKTARSYKTKKGAQDAHEAIRPTTMLTPDEVKASLKGDEYKLYKLIFSRFIASQAESAVYKTLNADIACGKANFKAGARELSFPGYLAVYTDSDNTEETVKHLPVLKSGDILTEEELNASGHFTEPPARYNEASLIKAMEEAGIGRPSTYAPTLSTILARRYVERDKKALKPTELGKIITDMLTEYFKSIVDIEFTANMEDDLDKVGDGNEKWTKVVGEFYAPFEKDLAVAEKEMGEVTIQDEETDVICELCGRNMVIKNGRFGKFLACPGYPDCSFTKAIVDETNVPCPECGDMIIGRFSKKGKKYYPCRNKDCNFLLWDRPTGDKCEKCGSMMITKEVRGETVVRCSDRFCGKNKK